mgnify:CR=1 FL=1
MNELTRFWRDDRGNMIETIVTLGIVIVVAGATLRSILRAFANDRTGLIYQIIEFLDDLVPTSAL